MKLSETKKAIAKIDDNILASIDLKIENDMEKVLSKMEHLEQGTSQQFSTLYWVVGLTTAFLAILISVLALIPK